MADCQLNTEILNDQPPSRRGFLGHAAGAVFAVTALSASTSETVRDRVLRSIAWMQKLNDGGASEADYDAWEAFDNDMLREVEALPLTAENAQVRALAYVRICSSELPLKARHDECTDNRLLRQIVGSLT